MTDQQPTSAEIVGSQQPHLSPEAIQSYRETMAGYEKQLADPATHPAMREHIEKMQRHIRDAFLIAGQSLEPPADPRTPAQIHFDKQYAMEPDHVLIEACQRESKSQPPDPGRTAKHFENVGKSYTTELKIAQQAVDRFPQLSGVKPENLPPELLASLATFWRHFDRFQDQRP